MSTTIGAPPSPKFGEINMPGIGRVVGFPYLFVRVDQVTMSLYTRSTERIAVILIDVFDSYDQLNY